MGHKVAIIDYISYTNKEEKPTGHPLKVIKEYAEWLQPYYKITFVAARPYLDRIRSQEKMYLSYHIREEENYTSFLGKIKQMKLEWKNLNEVFRKLEVDFYWFCNIDIFLIFYLAAYPSKAAKCIITTYLAEFPKTYHNRMAKRIFEKLKLIIGSNREIKYIGHNFLYIPDYLYKHSIYSKYTLKEKKNYVLCLGTMSQEKDLRGLITTFNKSGLELKIIGYFSDNIYFQNMQKIANENIYMCNKYLQYEEYLSLLGTAKFCILPYDKMAYARKTSGIILESIFVNAIPVCNNEILKRLGVFGKGYVNIEELSNPSWFYQDYTYINDSNIELIHKEYDEKQYIGHIRERLK